jgi:hypothetical protein
MPGGVCKRHAVTRRFLHYMTSAQSPAGTYDHGFDAMGRLRGDDGRTEVRTRWHRRHMDAPVSPPRFFQAWRPQARCPGRPGRQRAPLQCRVWWVAASHRLTSRSTRAPRTDHRAFPAATGLSGASGALDPLDGDSYPTDSRIGRRAYPPHLLAYSSIPFRRAWRSWLRDPISARGAAAWTARTSGRTNGR